MEGPKGLAGACALNAMEGGGAPHLVDHLELEGTQPRWARVREKLGIVGWNHGLDRGYVATHASHPVANQLGLSSGPQMTLQTDRLEVAHRPVDLRHARIR
ncbi:hypothetical protein Adt_27681 [Abeliophyllum distichum]|uniref:Uncharacterized protein n=1 Tax=Abeliophyllum distichum TaxID=126358 RepID=A0ABD1RWG3_9LAMI